MDKYFGPNDQRANVKNPNNSDYKNNNDNRANQKNPNNPRYKG
ncbi:hypothetical protein [Mesomycoplasma bovoculi]|uniref:Uncharacterized protein n=1 Tax=Mesomycoplasma bovoculi M165/69 TaxID=743966 RepID=W5UT86_9BACT|nr:hypothetical protein [Mesomycoplasma bovoculi]AHH45357.1 hypothetical protein MYB_01735 [Mesomycoplasma bovoculi M165/69]